MPRKGFVQLRRGILDHLSVFNGSEMKLYVALLCLAAPRTGRVTTTASDLADITSYGPQTILLDLKHLEELEYITYKPARNQYSPAVIFIKKWAQCAPTETHEATRGQPVGNHRSKAGAQAAELQEGAPDSQIAREPENPDTKEACVSGNGEDFQTIWTFWLNHEGEQEAQESYRLYIRGPVWRDEFLQAAKNYTDAKHDAPSDKTKHLANFIGDKKRKPWREWIDGDPNAKPYCVLDDGTKIKSQAEAQSLLDKGEIDEGGGRWRRVLPKR